MITNGGSRILYHAKKGNTMHPKLLSAIKKAEEHAQKHVAPAQDGVEELRKELDKLTKKQLIEKIVAESAPKADKVKIEDIVYAILEDPDCAWLTWDVIASVIRKHVPDCKTTPQSLRWYPSEGYRRGKTIVPRKKTAEIAKLLAEEL